MLREVATAVNSGLAITVAPHQTVLTTSQAADVLGVSRPTLVRLLDQGEIAYERPGRHRRVRLVDVLAHRDRARRRRAATLDEMVRISEEAGLYGDIDPDQPPVGVEPPESDTTRAVCSAFIDTGVPPSRTLRP